MLVKVAMSQRIIVHINRIKRPNSRPKPNRMRVSIRLPKATSMVAKVNGIPARMTSENAIIRSFTNPQILGS